MDFMEHCNQFFRAIWVPLYEDQSDKYVNYIINDCSPKLMISNKEYNQVENINNLYLYENFINDINSEILVNHFFIILK